MEPADALQAIEIVLRLLVRDVLGEQGWLDAAGAPDREKLEQHRDEEVKRRDGTVVSTNLIDYTEIYHLSAMIKKNWDRFKPALSDKGRTETFLGIVEDVRNSVAHSRHLVPFERDLISGVAGMLRNQISIYRSSINTSSKYYPLIESVKRIASVLNSRRVIVRVARPVIGWKLATFSLSPALPSMQRGAQVHITVGPVLDRK